MLINNGLNSSGTDITLNSSGGIALGAFMAGVFFEIIKESVEGNSINIDIITGASAGAMTGAIASYYLLQDPQEAKKAFTKLQGNALYEAWVTEADMENIDSIKVMPREEFEIFKGDKRDPFSLLSGKAIENIAKLISDLPDIPTLKISHNLALLMTVTNLQGILLKNLQGDGKSISSAEVRKFFFSPGSENETNFQSKWKKIISSARASGAFPLAFPPIKDSSDPLKKDSNFQDLNLSDDYFKQDSNSGKKILNEDLDIVVRDENTLKLEFSYSDGGILDNLPILKGIEIEANLKDDSFNLYQNFDYQKYKDYSLQESKSDNSDRAEQTTRFHVYVQPTPVVNLKKPKRLTQTLFSLWEMVLSGLTLPQQEHEAIQLKRIQEIQKQVDLKQELIGDFGHNEDLKKRLEEKIPYNAINLSPITPLIIGEIVNDSKLSDLKPLYDDLVEHSPLIESGLGLNGNDSDPEELLASDFIRAFGGFFDRKYREHDFILGRICGVTWLRKLDIQIDRDKIAELQNEIKAKILKEAPRVKLSYRIRLTRIFIRFLRISYLELKPVGIWIFVYWLLFLPVIFSLRILELILTILLWLFKDIIRQ